MNTKPVYNRRDHDFVQRLEGNIRYLDRELDNPKSEADRRLLEQARNDTVRDILVETGFKKPRRS